MTFLPLSWLESSQKPLAQAVLDWSIHQDSRALRAWLASSNRKIGDIEQVTPEKMQSFVQGVLDLHPTAAMAYHLPMEWPAESIERTRVLRELMLLVPAWREQASESLNSPNELGIMQVLYPTEEAKAILASNHYTPGTEAWRMHLGMKSNPVWWRKLPLWTQAEKDEQAKSNAWGHLLREVLAESHPEQGTRLALLSQPMAGLQRDRQNNGESPSAFGSPTPQQVLDSNIQGKMALALWQALNCPRDAIPEPSWWAQWDQWCQTDQKPAELALASLLLSKIASVEGDSDHTLRQTLVRLVSLRSPPENYSITSMYNERKKYADLSMDALLERTMPMESRTLRLFEGLATGREQLLLHYQSLQEETQPKLGLTEIAFGELLNA